MHIWYHPVLYNTETQCLSSWICSSGERFLLVWARLKELFDKPNWICTPAWDWEQIQHWKQCVCIFLNIRWRTIKKKGSNTLCNTPSSVLSWKTVEEIEVHFMLEKLFFFVNKMWTCKNCCSMHIFPNLFICWKFNDLCTLHFRALKKV
jgi:hypothetical protein